MKVLHLNTNPDWGGGEQQLAYLLEGAPAFSEISHHVVCASGSRLEAWCRERSVPCTVFRRAAGYQFGLARRLGRLASGADLIHGHDSHAAAAIWLASLGALRTPVVLARRVAIPVGRGPFSRWKYNHRAIRAIVCDSAAIEATLRPALESGTRTRVIHSAVDVSRFAAPVEEPRRWLVPGEAPLVGAAVGFYPLKGPDLFLDTAKLILREAPETRFVLAGEGPMRPALAARVLAEGLGDRVVLPGFVAREQMPAFMASLDVFLLTSRSEGLGGVLLEAQTRGTPVVAPDIGGVSEIVDDDVTGLLFEVGDRGAAARATLRLLREPETRRRITEAARAVPPRFSRELMVGKTFELYREILSPPTLTPL